jgi:SAM-dependent methyltransferase
MNLNKDYWENRWQAHQIGWDLGMVSPPIAAFFSAPVCQPSDPILIPGCGNAHEAEFLLKSGYSNIVVIDISPTACKVLTAKFHKEIDAGKIKVLCEDFFKHKGQYKMIVEQTFFCALDPSLRSQYVAHMGRLLKPDGKLVGLLFNKDFEGGPPFGGHQKEYEELFGKAFGHVNITHCNNSAAPRMGSEVWIEISNARI